MGFFDRIAQKLAVRLNIADAKQFISAAVNNPEKAVSLFADQRKADGIAAGLATVANHCRSRDAQDTVNELLHDARKLTIAKDLATRMNAPATYAPPIEIVHKENLQRNASIALNGVDWTLRVKTPAMAMRP